MAGGQEVLLKSYMSGRNEVKADQTPEDFVFVKYFHSSAQNVHF